MELAVEYYVTSSECSRTLNNCKKERVLCHNIGNLYLDLLGKVSVIFCEREMIQKNINSNQTYNYKIFDSM